MKKLIILIPLIYCLWGAQAQRLLVRGDDIGSSHAANVATIRSYADGAIRSTEIMIVCPWTPEAVKMLKENPGLDVGLHLVFTSEWENIKWRPLTDFRSATDEYGYFLPCSYPNPNYPGRSLSERTIEIAEAEAEIRAQIELALKMLPDRITHCTGHMGGPMITEELARLTVRLCDEYGVPMMDYRGAAKTKYGFEEFPMRRGKSPQERTAAFIETLGKLEKGKTYMYIEHPALDNEEMSAVWHIGYKNVGADRQAVTDMFTHPETLKAIADNGIELVGYGDLVREYKAWR